MRKSLSITKTLKGCADSNLKDVSDKEILEAVKMCTGNSKPCHRCSLHPLNCAEKKRDYTLRLATALGCLSKEE